ncbi:MAG: mRNA-degrading endonuclease RelE of RelBE toxin-antitoxin system [Patescibacteria group bacterium]|jgi:mRNA-degrading endonuclease RelE of RelBE toxin-antitoxin system
MKKAIQSSKFQKIISKLDKSQKIILKKLIHKILENPLIGKPMRYERKGTREIYMKPFRLSYEYDQNAEILTFLHLYHKRHQ